MTLTRFLLSAILPALYTRITDKFNGRTAVVPVDAPAVNVLLDQTAVPAIVEPPKSTVERIESGVRGSLIVALGVGLTAAVQYLAGQDFGGVWGPVLSGIVMILTNSGRLAIPTAPTNPTPSA